VPRDESGVSLVVAPEAIVFDCDGVLVDSDASVVAAWTAWADARGLDPGRVVEACHGQPARATVAAFVEPGDVIRALAEIDRLELELAAEARALPGARELVAALPLGRWALCTSGNWVLATARLRASGIDAPPVFITADDVTHGKPDPEGYALAIRRLGADPAASVVIEDAPSGVIAARAAGVGTVIGVGERARDADVDAIVVDLRAVAWDGERLGVGDKGGRRP
jgi:sugar-phosphatase